MLKHALAVAQHTGRCASSLQVKQKVDPHLQAMSMACCPTSMFDCTAKLQPGAGHHAIRLCEQAGSQQMKRASSGRA